MAYMTLRLISIGIVNTYIVCETTESTELNATITFTVNHPPHDLLCTCEVVGIVF